eukprot:760852-Hanusia_phi.AAC.2
MGEGRVDGRGGGGGTEAASGLLVSRWRERRSTRNSGSIAASSLTSASTSSLLASPSPRPPRTSASPSVGEQPAHTVCDDLRRVGGSPRTADPSPPTPSSSR